MPGAVVSFFFSRNVHDPNRVAMVVGSALFWSLVLRFVIITRRKALARQADESTP